MYEVFDHTADIGLRVRAASLEALFVEAARGLFSLIVVNPDDVRDVNEIAVRLQDDEPDYLLLDWLNELLFLFESRRVLLVEFDVKLDGDHLSATARGEVFDPKRHELDHEVKAITYHGLKVERDGDGWLAEVIVDI
jgi:SHS2 domain-containing protein